MLRKSEIEYVGGIVNISQAPDHLATTHVSGLLWVTLRHSDVIDTPKWHFYGTHDTCFDTQNGRHEKDP